MSGPFSKPYRSVFYRSIKVKTSPFEEKVFIWKLATLTFCSFENLSTKVSQAKKKIIKSCFFRFKTAAPSAYTIYITIKNRQQKSRKCFFLFVYTYCWNVHKCTSMLKVFIPRGLYCIYKTLFQRAI